MPSAAIVANTKKISFPSKINPNMDSVIALCFIASENKSAINERTIVNDSHITIFSATSLLFCDGLIINVYPWFVFTINSTKPAEFVL
jgi:hypothetical protein